MLYGLDLSQNITPPRAPCGANKRMVDFILGEIDLLLEKSGLSYMDSKQKNGGYH